VFGSAVAKIHFIKLIQDKSDLFMFGCINVKVNLAINLRLKSIVEAYLF